MDIWSNFMPFYFLEMLQIYCKFILGTLGIPSYDQQKQKYQLMKNFGD